LPAIFASIAVLLSLPLYWFGMQRMGVAGIALAVSLSAILQIVILYGLWNRRSGNAGSQAVYNFYGRVIITSVPLGVVLEWLRKFLLHYLDTATTTGSLLICAIIGLCFVVLFLLAGYLFKIREIAYLVEKMTGKKTSPGPG